jgi:hypothetical protein
MQRISSVLMAMAVALGVGACAVTSAYTRGVLVQLRESEGADARAPLKRIVRLSRYRGFGLWRRE